MGSTSRTFGSCLSGTSCSGGAPSRLSRLRAPLPAAPFPAGPLVLGSSSSTSPLVLAAELSSTCAHKILQLHSLR